MEKGKAKQLGEEEKRLNSRRYFIIPCSIFDIPVLHTKPVIFSFKLFKNLNL